MKKTIQKGFNEQINSELVAAYAYFAMATYFEAEGLKGFSHWMKLQAQEELGHAMKLSRFVVDRGGKLILSSVQAPKQTWESILAVLEEALVHEKQVTAQIDRLVDLSISEKDYASHTLLQWFITEQVEEEATAQTLVHQVQLIGKNQAALFLLDRELAARTMAA